MGRPPQIPGHWYHWNTNGWGIFDFLELCLVAPSGERAPGNSSFMIMPVVSFQSRDDLPGFIEYVWGDASSTKLGQLRARDRGVATPYPFFTIALGNEVGCGGYDRVFGSAVGSALEHARKLGLPTANLSFAIGCDSQRGGLFNWNSSDEKAMTQAPQPTGVRIAQAVFRPRKASCSRKTRLFVL